jgi:hypothetical protein
LGLQETSMSGTIKPPIGITTVPPRAASKSSDLRCLGIELPFGWHLVRGDELRRLQMQLHEAEQTAALRLRMCGNLNRKLIRRESR